MSTASVAAVILAIPIVLVPVSIHGIISTIVVLAAMLVEQTRFVSKESARVVRLARSFATISVMTLTQAS